MYNNREIYCKSEKHSAQQGKNKNAEQQHNDVNNCMASSSKSIRCVLVGDACVGKTSLIVAYTKNGFSDRYVPTAFDNYSVTVNVDEKPLKLELCDTAGRAEFDSIRPLSYVDANVFLICFSTVRPSSFDAVTERWLPELRAVSSTTPIILVGTQSDLRFGKIVYENGLNTPADPKLISKIANHFQIEYIESSAITQHNLKEVFDLAILYGLNKKTPPNTKVPKKSSSSLRSNVNNEKNAKNSKIVTNKTKTSPSASAAATIRGLLSNAMNGSTSSILNNNNSHFSTGYNNDKNKNNNNNNEIGYHNINVNTNSKFYNVTNNCKNNKNNNNMINNSFPTNLSKKNKIDSGKTHENDCNKSSKSANNYFSNEIKQNKDSFYLRQTPFSPKSASNITNYGCGYDTIRNERSKPAIPSTTIKAGFKKFVSMTRRFL